VFFKLRLVYPFTIRCETPDKMESAAELAQYKAELDEKMKKITDFMEKQQLASTPSATEAQTQESSNVRFFKH